MLIHLGFFGLVLVTLLQGIKFVLYSGEHLTIWCSFPHLEAMIMCLVFMVFLFAFHLVG